MKFKLFAVVLALSLIAWAQENPAASTPNATPKAETQSCCHHAEGAKDAMACGHHATADAKDGKECCGKDASCCGKDKNKVSAQCEKDGKSCCSGKDMKACAKQCKKDGGCADGKCCGAAEKSSAMNCCGDKCERKRVS
jgi:hypothetical protein